MVKKKKSQDAARKEADRVKGYVLEKGTLYTFYVWVCTYIHM